MATSLFKVRSGALFRSKWVRELLADFAPTLGVVAGTLGAVAAKNRWNDDDVFGMMFYSGCVVVRGYMMG